MLCSARPGKSCSNWLDRLRSNKGIPTGDGIDLDSFLTAATHSHSTNSNSDQHPKNPTTRTHTRTRVTETHNPPLSSVLAELFDMGGSLSQSSKLPGKKCPRKQKNPKSFVVASSSSNSSIDHVPAAANSFHSGVVAEAEEKAVDGGDENEEQKENENENERNEKDDNELRGFSKSEVTVIDTSCPGWKVDKLVFRKNNVWKVRERKPKSKFFAKKKRKGTLLLTHGSEGEHKPNKALEYQFGIGIGTSAETNDKEKLITMSPSTQGQHTQHERRETCKDTQDDLIPPPKKRKDLKSREREEIDDCIFWR